MALTAEQKRELDAILAQTGGGKESAVHDQPIPADYRTWMDKCDRVEKTLAFPGLAPVRVIVTAAKEKGENAPLHVNYHGGGFLFPQNQDDDLYCAHLAAGIGGVVVDVDYAVSRDHPYPMAVNQSYAVARWAYSRCREWGCDPKRFSVGGSSAGGNLALTVGMKACQTQEFPLCLMVLEYAASDNTMCLNDPTQSRSRAFSLYYADGDVELLKDPYLSPVNASDQQLRGLPRTLFIAPKQCPFYEVNQDLARRMSDLGVEVTVHSYEARHAFIVRRLDDWRGAQEDVLRALRAASL